MNAKSDSKTLKSLFLHAERLLRERADLRERFDSIASIDYWFWLMSEGLRSDPGLAEAMQPPPDSLMKRVIGESATADFYFDSGLNQAAEFYEALSNAGLDFERAGAMLDFGCGCARVLRFFARFANTWELVGADVDAESMQWCQETIDYSRFVTLSAGPPSPFPDGYFDAIYAYSVFSHLEEGLHQAWLEDLCRIARPDGLLALTTQGRVVMEKAMGNEVSEFHGSPDQLREALPRFKERGFLFYPYDFDTPWMPSDYGNDSLYGMTFISEDYIRAEWGRLFEIVSFTEGHYQDMVVLRPKP